MRILIIQILRMGDAVQLVPIIKGIKDLFPQARLDLLTSRLGDAILREIPEVSEIHIFEKEKILDHLESGTGGDIRSAIGLLRENLSPVLQLKWDWVINFSYSFPSALLSFIVDAKHRSGMVANSNRQYIAKEEWFRFSLASFMNRRYSNFNWVDIYKNILGLSDLPPPPYLIPKKEESKVVHHQLKELGYEGCRIIGMHPGASNDYKRWPVEKFGRLGRMLTRQDNTKIIVFGDETESQLGHQLKSLIGDSAEDLTGQTPLEALKAYLSCCDLLVTNDTGPMHLAAAVGTQSISLFFSTHYVETGPYGPGHFVIHPDLPCFPCRGTSTCFHRECLSYISPEVVAETIEHARNGDNRNQIALTIPESDNVRIVRSRFDPWGNMDWMPVTKHSISFVDLEKLMLKIAWLSYTRMVVSTDPKTDVYIQQVIQQYETVAGVGGLATPMEHTSQKLDQFKDLLLAATKICFSIQEEWLNSKPESIHVQKLGNQLSDIEKTIEASEAGTSLSFLIELLTVFRENIELTDPLDLSTKTISEYRNLINLTDIMITRADRVKYFLAREI